MIAAGIPVIEVWLMNDNDFINWRIATRYRQSTTLVGPIFGAIADLIAPDLAPGDDPVHVTEPVRFLHTDGTARIEAKITRSGPSTASRKTQVSFQKEQKDQGLMPVREATPGPKGSGLGPSAIAKALSGAATQMPLAMPKRDHGLKSVASSCHCRRPQPPRARNPSPAHRGTRTRSVPSNHSCDNAPATAN